MLRMNQFYKKISSNFINFEWQNLPRNTFVTIRVPVRNAFIRSCYLFNPLKIILTKQFSLTQKLSSQCLKLVIWVNLSPN